MMSQTPLPDTFGHARRRASELALQDARAGRRRTAAELSEALLSGRPTPASVVDELHRRYTDTVDALARR